MSMTDEHPDYHSYLLRMWRENATEKSVWRASLESSLTGEQQGFAGLDDLFNFLQQQTSSTKARMEANESRDSGKK
jgi:hypothetical protein